MQARYYDPVMGRFLSHDPVQFSVEQPLFFNRYGYTFNNPINLVDPDGGSPAKIYRFGEKLIKYKGNVKKAGKETFIEVKESLGELTDGDLSWDDAAALFDLVSPKSSKEIKNKFKKRGKKARDSGKNSRHGNERQAKSFENKIKELEKELESATTRSDKVKIKTKIQRTKEKAAKVKKGTEDSRNGPRKRRGRRR